MKHPFTSHIAIHLNTILDTALTPSVSIQVMCFIGLTDFCDKQVEHIMEDTKVDSTKQHLTTLNFK